MRAIASDAQSLSIALGELVEWRDVPTPAACSFHGFSFRKLGLAGSGDGWADEWQSLRTRLGDGPAWVAVAYSDWQSVSAPEPSAVLSEAIAAGCAGVLVDTFEKTRQSTVDLTWRPWVDRAHEAGLFVALAGGLDVAEIERLAPLGPDLYAVRGAACVGGRQGTLVLEKVLALSKLARAVGPPNSDAEMTRWKQGVKCAFGYCSEVRS